MIWYNTDLTCSQKHTGSQLSLLHVHVIKQKFKQNKRTKGNPILSMISLVQSNDVWRQPIGLQNLQKSIRVEMVCWKDRFWIVQMVA